MSNRRQREAAKQVHVRLTDRTQAALDTLHADVQALTAMVEDLTASQTALLDMLKSEVVAYVSDLADGDGVEAFANQPQPETLRQRGELPDAMQHTEPVELAVDEVDRIRATPFTRAPRYVQVAWLREVMADGAWHSGSAISRTYATDERHYRYMRSAVTSRLKEMHEESLVERRDSHTRGSMYEYRLVGHREE